MNRRVWITRDDRGDGAEFDCYSIWAWNRKPIFQPRDYDFGGCWVGRDTNEKEIFFEGLIAGDLCPKDFRKWTGYSLKAGEIEPIILSIDVITIKEKKKCQTKKSQK